MAVDARTIITSPVTGEVIAETIDTSPHEVAESVARLRRRFEAPGRPAQLARNRLERCTKLDQLAGVIEHEVDALAELLVLEHGKPVGEARGEIGEAADMIRVTASHARAFATAAPIVGDVQKRLLMSDLPIGVVAAITPWNLPYYVPFEYIAPALALGNSVLWKPAESTPLSNRRIAEMVAEAGFDEDEFVYLEGGPVTGRALVDAEGIDALGFTGSTEVGLAIRGASRGRPLLLEMGGNGPTIVFADADLERAAAGVAFASFWCAGQSCSATERVLVDEAVSAAFGEALEAAAREYPIADPRAADTRLGPVHLPENTARMRRHIDDAVACGARVVAGGVVEPDMPTDRYWQATILDGVPRDALVFKEETFGPIAPITTFRDEGSVIQLSLDGGWGLESAIYTADIDRALRVSDALPAGFVVINDHSNYWEPQLPFGGGWGTQSGTGRLGIEHTLRFMSQPRAVALHQA